MNPRVTPGIRSLSITLLLATLTLASVARAQPTLNKTFVPDVIGPGSVTTLRFDITNADGSPVRGLAFTDNLPAGMTISSVPNTSIDCFGGILSAPAGGTTISYVDGGIGASSTCSISVDVTSSTPGVSTNVSGDLTSDAGNGGNATADLTVDTGRPGVTKSFSPSSVFFGGRSTLAITIDNSANASQALNLNITDTLPAGMEIASPANASTTCTTSTLSAPAGGSVISYSFPTNPLENLAAGATCTISVDVIATSIGSLGNITGDLSSVVGFQTVSSGKASGVLDVTVERIALEKSFIDDPAAPGGTVNLQFTVRNLDRENTATDISFTDDLDATLSGLAAASLPADPCGAGSSLSGTSELTLSGGVVDPEGTCTFTVPLSIPAGATAGSYSNTTDAITAFIGEEFVTGDPASDLLFVQAVPVLTKTFIGDPVIPGDTIILEFTVTNSSTTGGATDITFSDEFDVLLPTASSVPGADPCGPGSTATYTQLIDTGLSVFPANVVLTGGNLAAGDSCTFSLVLDLSSEADNGTIDNTTSEITATVDGETVIGSPASDSFDIVAAPQLRKEFTDDPVLGGDTVTLEFTLIYSEEAPGDATAVSFQDDLAATLSGLTAVGLPLFDVCGEGSEIDGTTNLMFSGGTMAPGETCTFSVTLQVPEDATPGAHDNTTSMVVATVLGVETVGNAASDDLLIGGLTVTKEFIDDPVLPGGSVTLRFTATNTSPVSDVTDITFSDSLSSVLSNLVGTGLPLTDPCGTGSSLIGVSGDRTLFLTGGNLAVGESCSFDVTLSVPSSAAPGTYFNNTSVVTATIEGASIQFPGASDTLTVANDFLFLSKEFIGDPVAPGAPVTLRFTVDNQLNQDVTSISFSDDLDDVISGLVSTSGTLTDVCGTGSQITGTGNLVFSGGNLLAGATCTFDVTLLVPTNVDLGTLAINVTSEITGTFGGSRTVTGDPATDTLAIDSLGLSKSFSGDAVAGGTVQLTFTIQNLSTTTAVRRLSFTDDFDAVIPGLTSGGLTLEGICGESAVVSGTSVIDFRDGELLPGGSCTFSVDVTVPAGAAAGTYTNVTSELLVSGIPEADPATADLTVTTEADLSLTKTDSADPVLSGDSFTYILEVGNGGPSDASGVVVTDNLPAGLTLVSTTGCAEDPVGVPTCTLGDMPANSAALVAIEVTAGEDATGVVTNNASIASATTDPDEENNFASEDTTINDPQADLSITKTDSADPVVSGDSFTYTIVVANAGPQDATGVVVTDNLPAGVTLVATTGCAEDPNGTPTCSLGTIAVGGSAQYTIEVTGGAPGVVTNTASVASEVADPDGSNNSASEDTTISPADDDGDGVPNGTDYCDGTVIPEGVPTVQLKPNRYALVDGDLVFDTVTPPGGGAGDVFTTTDTAGCSCEQIIEEAGLGKGHSKFGCSVGAMRNWVEFVNGVPVSVPDRDLNRGGGPRR